MTGSLFEVDDYSVLIQIKNLILPTLPLAIRPLSVIVQLTRKFISRSVVHGLYSDCES